MSPALHPRTTRQPASTAAATPEQPEIDGKTRLAPIPASLTPLSHASGIGDVELVEALLLAGASPLALDPDTGRSPLHAAAQSGHIAIVDLLLGHGALLSLQSPLNGHAPLHDAVQHRRIAMVLHLVTRGAPIGLYSRASEQGGYTAAGLAERRGFADISAALDRAEARSGLVTQSLTLHEAVRYGDVERVASLIRAGAVVNEPWPLLGGSDDGHTPLHMAARDGHARIAELLLEAGASPNAPELVMRSTPGHKAAVGGHCDVLGLLLRHGYEIDVQGPYNGYTALHDAAWFGHAEAALVLLAGNARADLRGHDGRTPADIAIEDGYPKVAAVLARHGGTR